MQLGLSQGEGNGCLSLRPLPDVGDVEEADSSRGLSTGLLALGEVRVDKDINIFQECVPRIAIYKAGHSRQVCR